MSALPLGTGAACAYRRTGTVPVYGTDRFDALTEREREVLLLLGTGLGNRRLASELGIAERTVKAHITRIAEKLGQETRLQVSVLSALSHGGLCADPACAGRYTAAPSGVLRAFAA
ncbi:helix-turn-helix transcriptional regulator [Streptomyces somaliensis DSM 40738]|uniref:Helix-turn-helix transcriptional regulator n=1 Tax=Streptomyces somaliensis (strain ATCC 33201 / DSM 40738 / JCM 12659 / KCTC 9044 / NCTC 11332 / NRRL B-12077 / IP 733) TaxID=1134445 RepID=A0AA44DD79_STRE0|nr:helix-turn-helix transcriptional regulator [Streptomyces somaliensis]MCQ0022459.1 helix-turn-helix transcriptional regulator [Streptomyces somaliensis DSM 40738]NKY14597.1 helix-turn-helix transcriptional regulator [Streptomyces somaliensis DSM 40738]